MNTAQDIFNYTQSHNISMTTKDGKLKINGPETALTNDFLSSAKEYKQEIIEVLSNQHFKSMARIDTACYGLEITPSQFAAICTKEDLQLISKGEFSPKSLRAYAESIDDGIKSKRISFHPMTDALIKHEVGPNQPGGAA